MSGYIDIFCVKGKEEGDNYKSYVAKIEFCQSLNMEASLRASTQGLEIVNQARKYKGWNRQASAWYQKALTSLPTLKRFLQGEPIEQETFIRIYQAVGLEHWEEIVDSSTVPIPPLSPPLLIADWSEAPESGVF